MNVIIKGIHYDVSERTKEQVMAKLEKLHFADKEIEDVEVCISHQDISYPINVNLHMKWGVRHHLTTINADLYDCIDDMIGRLTRVVRKEKERRMQLVHHRV